MTHPIPPLRLGSLDEQFEQDLGWKTRKTDDQALCINERGKLISAVVDILQTVSANTPRITLLKSGMSTRAQTVRKRTSESKNHPWNKTSRSADLPVPFQWRVIATKRDHSAPHNCGLLKPIVGAQKAPAPRNDPVLLGQLEPDHTFIFFLTV